MPVTFVEKDTDVVIFHDASVSSIGVIIYLLVVSETGAKCLRVVRSGTKYANNSIPTLEHVSRTYSLVMLKPMLAVLKQVSGDGLNFIFASDSTCSLRLLKEDVRTTNKLASNCQILIQSDPPGQATCSGPDPGQINLSGRETFH